MKDVAKLIISILALVGWIELCISHQWVGAAGVFLVLWHYSDEASESALRITKAVDAWVKKWQKRKEEKI